MKSRTICLTALLAIGCLAGLAQASPITFSVVALGSDGVTESSTLSSVKVGDQINIRLYANFANTDGIANDGIRTFIGNMQSVAVSGSTLLKGNLALGTLNRGLTASGASVGTLADIGDPNQVIGATSFGAGDGDLDIGTTSTTSSLNKIIGKSSGTSTYVTGTHVLLYSTTFTVTSAPDGSATLFEFVPYYNTSAVAANRANEIFEADAVHTTESANTTEYRLNGDGHDSTYYSTGGTGNATLYGIGITPLTVTGVPVPEPATIALLGLGLVGLIRRRRHA